MAEQPGLDVFRFQRLLQERVVVQIDLSDRQIVGGPPVRVQLVDLVRRQCAGLRWDRCGCLFGLSGDRSCHCRTRVVRQCRVNRPSIQLSCDGR